MTLSSHWGLAVWLMPMTAKTFFFNKANIASISVRNEFKLEKLLWLDNKWRSWKELPLYLSSMHIYRLVARGQFWHALMPSCTTYRSHPRTWVTRKQNSWRNGATHWFWTWHDARYIHSFIHWITNLHDFYWHFMWWPRLSCPELWSGM